MDPLESYLLHIQKQVSKRVRKHDHLWNYFINVKHTSYQPSDYMIDEIELEGEGSTIFGTAIHIYVRYRSVSHSMIHVRRKYCKDIRAALQYIFLFPKQFRMCPDCCQLYKKSCQDCLFYQEYHKRVGNEAVACAICKEPTYRTKLPCGHYFHRYCLLQMDRQEMKCPLCRCSISNSIMNELLNEDDEDGIDYNSSDSEKI